MVKKPPKKPPKKPRGRPPKKSANPPRTTVSHPDELPDQERRDLLAMLAIGVPPDDAACASGVHPRRLAEWMTEPTPGAPEDATLAAFRAEARRYEGRGVAENVRTVHVASDKVKAENHRWLLGKRRPSAFGTGEGRGSGPGGRPGSSSGQELEVDRQAAEQLVEALALIGVTIGPVARGILGLD